MKAAKDYDCAIRIEVNAGSLDKNILESIRSLARGFNWELWAKYKIIRRQRFFNFKISVKSSDVFSDKGYEGLSKSYDYPLHLGITEAGGLVTGSIKSSIGIGKLLMQGIGDTIEYLYPLTQ